MDLLIQTLLMAAVILMSLMALGFIAWLMPKILDIAVAGLAWMQSKIDMDSRG